MQRISIPNTPTSVPCMKCGAETFLEYPYVSVCPECGEAFVSKGVFEAYDAMERGRREAEKGDKMALAGIPALFHDVEADYGLANNVSKTGKGYYFQGGNGTFKSLKAASVAKAFLDRGESVLWASSAMLMAELRDAMGDREMELYRRMTEVGLLVLDDLGKENVTSWTVSTLFNVVDVRYGAKRPVIVTTNYKRADLVMRLSEHGDESTARAIISRLTEMTERVDFGNEDRRLS